MSRVYSRGYSEKQRIEISLLKRLLQKSESGKQTITESELSKRIKYLNNLAHEKT